MSRRRLGPWFVLALVLVALCPSYVRAYRVAGISDAPTYLLGQTILVHHAAYDLRVPYTQATFWSHGEPRVGDVVVAEEHGAGTPHAVTYDAESGTAFGPLMVPPGHYFMLGDHRDRSRDSRAFGPVPRAMIRGRVLGVVAGRRAN